MTDVVTPPTAGNSLPTAELGASVTDATTSPTGDVEYAWAPAEEQPKKRRLGWWIGVPSAALVVGVGIASAVLIAPGVTIAGVPVSGLTAGGAADSVSARLAQATITLDSSSGPVTVTGADLGASIDAQSLANDAFAQHPLWNVTAWNPDPIAGQITLDDATATAALEKVLPGAFVAPVEATVSVSDDGVSYVSTAAVDGQGIDLVEVKAALASALAGDGTATMSGEPVVVAATHSTQAAEATTTELNTMVAAMGFYVGEERTHPVAPADAISWLTVTPESDGTFAIAADQSAIQTVISSLETEINREPVAGEVIVNSDKTVLQTVTESVDGWTLGDTSGLARSAAEQLSDGNGVIALNVAVAEAPVTELFRRIDVNLSTQRAEAIENGQVVNAWYISSGAGSNATPTGDFTVRAHVSIQDMGNMETVGYLTKDVPWVMYFNGDVAFHGTYWHNNFGTPMSHGCINLPVDAAKWLYDWTPLGTQVSVHY